MADEDRLGDSVSGFDTAPREPSIEMFRQAQAVKRREGTLAAGGPMDPSARELLSIPPVAEQQAVLAPRDTQLGGVPIERGFEGIRDMLFPIGENVPARPTLPLPGLRREADLMGALDLLSNVADAGAPAAAKTAATKAGIPLAALMARTSKGKGSIGRSVKRVPTLPGETASSSVSNEYATELFDAARSGAPLRARMLRGSGSDAVSTMKSSDNAQFGDAIYLTDNYRTAEIFSEFRPGKPSVDQYDVELNKVFTDEIYHDPKDPLAHARTYAMPEYAKLRELMVEEGMDPPSSLFDPRRARSGIFEFGRNFYASRMKKKTGVWPGSERMRSLVERAGFDGIVERTRDLPDLPNHTQLIVFKGKPRVMTAKGAASDLRRAVPKGALASPSKSLPMFDPNVVETTGRGTGMSFDEEDRIVNIGIEAFGDLLGFSTDDLVAIERAMSSPESAVRVTEELAKGIQRDISSGSRPGGAIFDLAELLRIMDQKIRLHRGAQ
jgi:hypothetical protein